MKRMGRVFACLFGITLSGALLLAGCGHGDHKDPSGDASDPDGNEVVFSQGTLPPLTRAQVFGTDGQYSATIRRTSNGVPHIEADSLASAAFGEGYVQAKDNICIIADQVLRATSERAKYLGPGPGNANVITDFSFKALGLMTRAEQDYPNLSAPTKAMLDGFVAGYNQYLAETALADLPPRCAGASWVHPITPQQYYAVLQVIALLASGDVFATGATFAAAPPGVDPSPTPVSPGAMKALASTVYQPYFKGLSGDAPVASNGWAIGKDMTESGRGALLANPHFPYTGSNRFYQSQMTVPGVIDVNGASLLGTPLPLIGFNQDVAWTHTVSAADHFTVYQLQLKAGDPMTYMKDGEARPITSKTFQIEVRTAGPNPVKLQKTFYYSEYGPMLNMSLVANGLPGWGTDVGGGHTVAYTYRDANADTAVHFVNQWLGMGRSSDLAQFKSVFEDCGTTYWVNTLYADRDGNAWYADATSVPNLSAEAIAVYRQKLTASPLVSALYRNGLVLLDGSTSRDDWVAGQCGARVPFDQSPQLRRDDFVQNSNDSYWATNPSAPMTGYSPLFGPAPGPLSARTRMGLTMLMHPGDSGLSDVKPAGSDGKFSAEDLIQTLYSNRAYLAETLLPDLLERCRMIDADPVNLPGGGSRAVTQGCQALQGWDGVFDADSTGAGTFRVFVGHYSQHLPADYSVPFDPAHPVSTPGKPVPPDTAHLADDPMLQALAQGLNDLDSVDIPYDAPLGTIQVEHTSGNAPPGGTAQFTDSSIPWHGGQNLEGAFNIVEPITSPVAENTLYPIKIAQGTIPDTGQLSTEPEQGWLINRGTSFHFGLEFTDSGPVVYGLLSYAQSTDPGSPYYNDQDRLYSQKAYRRFRFTREEIENDPELNIKVITAAAVQQQASH